MSHFSEERDYAEAKARLRQAQLEARRYASQAGREYERDRLLAVLYGDDRPHGDDPAWAACARIAHETVARRQQEALAALEPAHARVEELSHARQAFFGAGATV